MALERSHWRKGEHHSDHQNPHKIIARIPSSHSNQPKFHLFSPSSSSCPPDLWSASSPPSGALPSDGSVAAWGQGLVCHRCDPAQKCSCSGSQAFSATWLGSVPTGDAHQGDPEPLAFGVVPQSRSYAEVVRHGHLDVIDARSPSATLDPCCREVRVSLISSVVVFCVEEPPCVLGRLWSAKPISCICKPKSILLKPLCSVGSNF
jgi:hypothetical protein